MTLLDVESVNRDPARRVAPDVLDRALALLDGITRGDGVAGGADGQDLRAWLDRQIDVERALGQLLVRAGAILTAEPAPVGSGSSRLGPPPAALEVPVPSPSRRSEPGLLTAPPSVTSSVVVPNHRATGLHPIGEPRPVRPVLDPPHLEPRLQRRARQALWVRNVGIIVLLFGLYQLWGTGFEQHRVQARLRAAFAAVSLKPSAAGADNPSFDRPAGAAPVRTPPGRPALLPGGVVAKLEIPAIHVTQFVVEGTGESDLHKGPGHYIGSSMPGEHGNAAIAGHRTTYGAPFSRLDELHPGDTIYTTTSAGRYQYVVSALMVVSPSQASVVDDYGDDRLTLTTCTPKFLATHRLVVVAKLEGLAAQSVVRVVAPAPMASRAIATNSVAMRSLRASDQVGFDLSALWDVVLVVVLLVGLALLYRPLRRWLPPVAAATVLAGPWIALLLLSLEQLNRFLPANV
jgi:sortase A